MAISLFSLIGETEETIHPIVTNLEDYYLSYPLKKKNKKYRWIDAPVFPLIDIQRKILYKLLYRFKAHESCMGFIKNKSVLDGANIHLGSKVLLTMDIENFFNSIKTRQVQQTIDHLAYKLKLNSKKYNFATINKQKAVYERLAISNLLTFKNQVPQGAPTSPIIANLVTYKMDIQMQDLADRNNCLYTRYADDVAFSSTNKDFNIGVLIPEVKAIIENNHFRVNYKKTKIRRPHNRMTVTGVVINEKLTVPRWKWRNFRAELHNLKVKDETISLEYYQKLRGYAEWIKSLHPKRGQKFIRELGKIQLAY